MGTLGYKHTEESKRKISENHRRSQSKESRRMISLALIGTKRPYAIGNGNSQWRGIKADYHQIHKWVNKHWGRTRQCGHCGTNEASRYEWANLDKEYDRTRPETWLRLCSSCHIKLDRYKSISIPCPPKISK